MGSAPNVTCMDKGRRGGNQEDFRNLIKLAQVHNIINTTGGYPVEPIDIHPAIRHLECLRDLSLLTDKAFHVYSLGADRNIDGIEIARLARGISEEQLLERAVDLFHHQHQLAAEAGCADDGRHHPDVLPAARSSSSRRSRFPARWPL